MTASGRLIIDVKNLEVVKEHIAQLTAELAEWKADAERLAKKFVYQDDESGSGYYCIQCEQYTEWKFGDYRIAEREQRGILHTPDCPITLHRELVAKYGETK